MNRAIGLIWNLFFSNCVYLRIDFKLKCLDVKAKTLTNTTKDHQTTPGKMFLEYIL